LKLTYQREKAKARVRLGGALHGRLEHGRGGGVGEPKAEQGAMASVGDGAMDMPRRVIAASANDAMSVRRTPSVSAMEPTRNTNSVTMIEKPAAQLPADLSSLMP
jgi:hypothetical protein